MLQREAKFALICTVCPKLHSEIFAGKKFTMLCSRFSSMHSKTILIPNVSSRSNEFSGFSQQVAKLMSKSIKSNPWWLFLSFIFFWWVTHDLQRNLSIRILLCENCGTKMFIDIFRESRLGKNAKHYVFYSKKLMRLKLPHLLKSRWASKSNV